jgi:peroxiredoxin
MSGTEILLHEGPSLLIFMRGLWCEHCQEQLADLAVRAPQFDELGVRIVVVSGDNPLDCRRIESIFPQLPWIICDPDGVVIDQLALRDHLPDRPHPVAFPTSCLLDAAGIVQFCYVGRLPEDRPSADLLLLAARRVILDEEC